MRAQHLSSLCCPDLGHPLAAILRASHASLLPLQTLPWGSKNSLAYNLALTKDIVKGDKVVLDFTLKTGVLPVPLKIACPLCGANCTIVIPVVKQSISFALPACPIKAGTIAPGKHSQ